MQTTILIADDDVSNLNILRNYLEESDNSFRILRATNGKKASDIAFKELPDLILLDWEMPVMNGIDALARLKSHELTKEIPVIMVTARTRAEDLERALEIGAMDYIKKPIDKVELLARVRSAIKLRFAYKNLENTRDKLAGSLKEIRRKNHELEKAYENITDSIRYAQRIQSASLIKSREIIDCLPESFIFYAPRDIVSGDFYWASQISVQPILEKLSQKEPAPIHRNYPSQKTIIAAIDCTGHGVPGALMTMLGRALLDNIVNENYITEPAQILYALDAKVKTILTQNAAKQESRDGMDMSVLSVDHTLNQVTFAGAKHMLYIIKNRELFQIPGSRYPIGGSYYDAKKDFESHTLKIKGDETFYLATDGFQDQFGGRQNQKYMRKRFRSLLLKNSHLSLSEQAQAMRYELTNWKGSNSQTDDILVLGIKF